MNKKRRNKSYFGSRMILPLVILGIVIFTTVFAICTEKEKRVGDKALTNSIEFLRQRCIRYDNLVSSEETKDQMSLVDKTRELGRCLGTGEVDEDFLNDYATDQRLTSIILLDKDTKPISVVGSANQGYEAWCDIFKNENVIDVIKYPQKIYVSRMLQDDGNVYDYVVIARQRGEGLVFCCNKLIQSREDEMHIGIENLFSGYQFEMNGLVLIMDGEQILGSNSDEFIDTKIADYPGIQEHMSDISNNDVCKVQHDGTDYLARYSKCGSYYLAVLIPAKEIFRQRSVIMAYVFVLYVLFLLGFLLVRQNEMKNSNKRKMDFLRQMSHDIRTPINGIRGMVQIGNSFPDDVEKQKECMQKIWEASGILMELVNDVLDMGKLESGEIMLENKPFNLCELVETVCAALENQARENKVTLNVNKPEGTHMNLIGSPVHIQRILTNIINNAIKYNKENGSVTVSCKEIYNKSENNQTVFEFVCEDTGIGMSHEFKKRMFAPFTQENSLGEISHHGTGLGLAIVKNLIHEMKGQIRCESEVGKGTVFYITIPFDVDNSQNTADIEAEDTSDENLDGVNILLVEDNELNMEIAEFILEDEGATVVKAHNGEEAVSIFKQSKPGEIHIILMDMMMPVMDGETATRTIRALDRADAKTIPIIAMTANAFDEDIQIALNAGMNTHFAKPIDPNKLKKVIRKYLK